MSRPTYFRPYRTVCCSRLRPTSAAAVSSIARIATTGLLPISLFVPASRLRQEAFSSSAPVRSIAGTGRPFAATGKIKVFGPVRP